MKRKVAILGAGGFIGGHLAKRLKQENCEVVGVDLKMNPYQNDCDQFEIGDLRDTLWVNTFFEDSYDEVYQLAADMGGAGYIFTGDQDADIMHNSASINLNVLNALKNTQTKIFYSSSACIYPEHNQMDPDNPICSEESAYPANPDSEYGWEKLFSERLYLSYAKNYSMNIRIARFHNIFGPKGNWNDGKEKFPAALCRKVAQAGNNEAIEIWGDGKQTRSFLYIDECIEGIVKLMKSSYGLPLNIGSSEMISINDLTKMVIKKSGKTIRIQNIEGPTGVRGRSSDNDLILKELNWQPNYPLEKGMDLLYSWISKQL